MDEYHKIQVSDGAEIWFNYSEVGDTFVVFYTAASSTDRSLRPIQLSLNDKGLSTIIVIPRGQGRSSDAPKTSNVPRGDYSLERNLEDMTLITSETGAKNVVPVGYLTGFHVATEYAAKFDSEHLFGINCSHNFRETNPMAGFWDKYFRYIDVVGSVMRGLHNIDEADLTSRGNALDMMITDAKYWLSMTGVPPRRTRTHIEAGHQMLDWNITDTLKGLKKTKLHVFQATKDPWVKYYRFRSRFLPVIADLDHEVTEFNATGSIPMQYSEEIACSIADSI